MLKFIMHYKVTADIWMDGYDKKNLIMQVKS